MSIFYVKTNLNYNGKAYEIGDEISVPSLEVQSLLEADVIQEDPIGEESDEEQEENTAPEATPKAEAVLGGEKREDTGEPGYDKTLEQGAKKKEASDVTPGFRLPWRKPAGTGAPAQVNVPSTADAPEATPSSTGDTPQGNESSTAVDPGLNL